VNKTLASLCLAAVVAAACATSAAAVPRNSQILAGVNAQRRAHGLRRVVPDPRLAAAARAHSLEMLAHGYFDHDSANGTAFWRRVESFYGPWSVGEILLSVSPDVSARFAVRTWMRSREHRAEILNPRWRQVGVSALHVPVAPGIFEGGPVTVITVDFGARG